MTKREVLELFAKCGNCNGIKCTDCPYYKPCKHCPNDNFCLKRIGAMAILRQNKHKRKFDPDKIFTCVTADKAMVGTQGYFGDDLAELKCNFKNNNFYELLSVNEEHYAYRFKSEGNDYALFYPIDEV